VNFQLEEKEWQLHCVVLENKQAARMYDAKLPADTHKGACGVQVLLNKQEDKVTLGTYYSYANFVVHLCYC
jgi:hypothetical protein